jgi:hypothetical protein
MPTEPSATELTKMATAMGEHHPELATVTRPTLTDDAFGGQSEADTVINTNVPCNIYPAGEGDLEQLVAQKISATGVWTICFLAGQDVKIGDLVTITSKGSFKLRVEAVLSPETYEVERRVLGSAIVT